MKKPRRILIVRPDRLGDLILSLPVAETLRQHYPESSVSYLAAPGPAQIKPLVPYVDQWYLDGDGRNRLGLSQLIQAMKSAKFDCVIELKPSLRTAAAALLARIDARIGTARRGFSLFYNERVDIHRKGSGKHQTDLDLELLVSLGIEVNGLLPRLELTATAIAGAKMLVGGDPKPYIVMHPGSGGSAPNWPIEYYRELAVMVMESAGYGVVITGNNDRIGDFDERCVDLNGKTDMEELAGVIAGAALFISGSTGPLHLADSLGVGCMGFFIRHQVVGPERWGPRRNMAGVMVPDRRCQCRDLSRCDCLRQVTPEKALNMIESILGS
ncbi:MAG: hypothetical protein A2W25_14535 [candidate division Zixibacteria bacterium RBG_16_53_22]|nr:MAG: hypothetical protein A2W25_14535 [candidate division Zixibacteria bacterium RBG_16_53_22]